MRLILPVTAGVIVAGALILLALRAKRERQRQRARDIPELNQHPERLEQMLDRTDDA